jgi:hypothetical protein
MIDRIDVLNGNDAPSREDLDRLRIVDQGSVRIDIFLALALGNIEDHINGPLHTHAETCRLSQLNAHQQILFL